MSGLGLHNMELDNLGGVEKIDTELHDQQLEGIISDNKENRVVREIEVYFNRELDPDSQLYIFDYPLRPSWRPYDLDKRCKEIRVHAKNKLAVEMDLTIDTTSKTYDSSQDLTRQMTTMTLTSTLTLPEPEGAVHVVGLLIGNKLCITPIDAFVQMRPLLDHSSSASTSGCAENVNAEKADWIALKYQGPKSDLASSYRLKMEPQNCSPIHFSMNPVDYLDSLCPPKDDNDSQLEGPNERVISLLPLEERCKKWLIEGSHINRFENIKIFAENETEEDLLRVLQIFATLVQGIWVTKTGLLTDVFKRPLSQVARHYVLLLFRKNNLISYDQIKAAGPLRKFLIEPLVSLAIERPSLKGWEFKEPRDETFIQFHPRIVEVQEKLWEDSEIVFMERFNSWEGEELLAEKSQMDDVHPPRQGSNSSGRIPDRMEMIRIYQAWKASNLL